MIVLLTFRYDTNPGGCGFYDDDFTANDMCCACNGGTKTRKKSLGVGSVVIIVSVIIGAVILAAVAYAVARKRRVAAKQHRNQSMPPVVAE